MRDDNPANRQKLTPMQQAYKLLLLARRAVLMDSPRYPDPDLAAWIGEWMEENEQPAQPIVEEGCFEELTG